MLYYFLGDKPKSFPKRSKCYIISCMKKWWAQDEKGGNGPGFWPLSPVWSAFHSDQWEGTVPGTGRWGTVVTHHISTIENRWTDFFQTMSIWRKPHFSYLDFSIFKPSAFSSPPRGRAWVSPNPEWRGARKSKCSSKCTSPFTHLG